MSNLTVACVLRSGGDYKQRHVDVLRHGVEKHLRKPHRFFCLDDSKMIHRWPNWWSKIELFRPGLFDGPVLYIDLDNVITGPLDRFTDFKGPVLMRDFFLGAPSTALMFWTGDELRFIYDRFARDPKNAMNPKHKISKRQAIYGDQSWVHKCLKDRGATYRFWQDLIPEGVSKFGPRVSRRTSVVCFMARHKPWNSHCRSAQVWRQQMAEIASKKQ